MRKEYSQEQKYIEARKRVEKIKGFYIHILVTVLISPFLVFINLYTFPQFHWFWFPILGMVLSLFFHWISIYRSNLFFGKKWQERKIKEFMNESK